MTIKELYEWAKDNNLLNYETEVKYRDAGGDYPDTDKELYLNVYHDAKVVVL